MAFNPFHAFRKYSKSMFAVLAIVCMLTFVLSSGLGGKNDFFTNIGDNFGAGSSKVPDVARLDGKKIDARMLQDTKNRRLLANTYMTVFAIQAKMRVIDHAEARMKGASPIISQSVGPILQDARGAAQLGPGYYKRAAQERRSQMPDQELPLHIYRLDNYIDSLNRDKKTDDADAWIKVRALLDQDQRRLSQPFQGGHFSGSIETEGLLDFMVWKHVADKQEIKLSPETVIKLIEAESQGEDIKDLMSEVETFMRSKPEFKEMRIATVLDALNDEFRVRIAQETLLGEGPRRYNVPEFATPYEFRKYYDDQRRIVKVDLLPVKVDDFLAQVKETPTDAELKELFEKHKKEEWTPQADHAGFKEPKSA